jgi:hypothetical protein
MEDEEFGATRPEQASLRPIQIECPFTAAIRNNSSASSAPPNPLECTSMLVDESWAPDRLQLSTDDGGVVDVVGIMGESFRGISIRLERRSEWGNDSLQSKQALVEHIQKVCLSCGFAVYCESFRNEGRLEFACSQGPKEKTLLRVRNLNNASNSPTETCQFQFHLTWSPVDKCWYIEGGLGHGEHSSSACRRNRRSGCESVRHSVEGSTANIDEKIADASAKSSPTTTSVGALTRPPPSGSHVETDTEFNLQPASRTRSTSTKDTGNTTTENAGSQQTILPTDDEEVREDATIRPASPPIATGYSNHGWKPDALWLPTEDGPVNILLHMPVECRGTLVLLAKQSAWHDNSPESKQAVVKCVRIACKSAGFLVYYSCSGTLQDANTIVFFCAARGRIHARQQKKKCAPNAEQKDDAPHTACKLCKFRMSLSWLPKTKRWAFKGGYGHDRHMSDACRLVADANEHNPLALEHESNEYSQANSNASKASFWEPKELLLRTDAGTCNIMLLMNPGSRGTVVKLESNPAWCDNSPACKHALAHHIQTQCLLSGFAVNYEVRMKLKIPFRCTQYAKFFYSGQHKMRGTSRGTAGSRKKYAVLDVCRFHFSLTWLPNEKRWGFVGGFGRCGHLSEACRRVHPMAHRPVSRSVELPRIAAANSPTAELSLERSWAPRELSLPTDSGSVNIVKLMKRGRNGSYIRMKALDEWSDNTVECRQALVQWVQRTCILSGFSVGCLSVQQHPLHFVCREAQNVKKKGAASCTRMSPSKKQIFEKSSCRFHFSLHWLPVGQRWAYQRGRGYAVHKDPACCRKADLSVSRLSISSTATAMNPLSCAIQGVRGDTDLSEASRGSATLDAATSETDESKAQDLFDPTREEICFPCTSGSINQKRIALADSNDTASGCETLPSDDTSSNKKSTENVRSAGEVQPRHQDNIAQGPTKRFKPEVNDERAGVDRVDEDSSEYCLRGPDPVATLNGHDGCSDKASKDGNVSNIEAETTPETKFDTRELFDSFVGMVNLAQGNPRAADYLKVCLSKCSRAMQAIVAWDNKHGDNTEALDADTMEFDC